MTVLFRCSGEEAFRTAQMRSRQVPATRTYPAHWRRLTSTEAALWLADASGVGVPRGAKVDYDYRSDSYVIIDPKDAEEFGR